MGESNGKTLEKSQINRKEVVHLENSFEEMFHYYDMFATKGTDYLLVLGILVGVMIFWRFLRQRPY